MMPEIVSQGSRLKDKVAIITGGAFGLGRAFGFGMAAQGAKIVVADINRKAAEVTARDIQSRGSEAIAVAMDVSKVEDTLETARKAVERFGKIDILVNNAGVNYRERLTWGDFETLDIAEFDRVIAVNLKGPFLCIRAVLPAMKKQNKGKIVNLASGTFFSGPAPIPHYVASKGGVIGLTRSLASALGKYNITVNAVAPGRTLNEDSDNKEAVAVCENRAALRSIKRVEYPEDLVGAVIFFASPDSDFITGQTLVVDGGDVKH
jgi:3-oxoacyl-[acyl-carrier protein] reductase